MKDTIGKVKLKKLFGPHALRVLSDRLQPIPDSNSFTVSGTLPTLEQYKALERAAFTSSLGDVVEGARSELESLRDELQDWYDNLPESFQNGDKGDQLQEAISALEDAISGAETDLPDFVDGDAGKDRVRVFAAPMQPSRRTSRADRGSQAAYELTQASEAIEEALEDKDWMTKHTPTEEVVEELKDYASTLRDAADSAEAVEYPGMY